MDAKSTLPDWRGAFRDLSREHGFEDLRLEGRLPAELRGTLYRNGPALFSTLGRPYLHWFDGDGAISAVRLEAGRARGAVRLVQSRALLDERRAGRALYGGFGTPATGWLRRVGGWIKNAANTSVLIWQGRLLALWEGGKPTELAPDTLATLGERDLDGLVSMTFSAHPHAVSARRAHYNFGIRYGRRCWLDLFELPWVGAARRLGSVPLPGASLIHDFIATEKHLIFFVPPLRLKALRMLLGLGTFSDCLAWDPSQGTEILIIPIDAPERLQRFTVEPFLQWHFANAFERDGATVVDFIRYPDFSTNDWLAGLLPGLARGGPRAAPAPGCFVRAYLEPRLEALRADVRWTGSCEFPRVAPAVEGREHRYVYASAHSAADRVAGLQDSIARIDVVEGSARLARFEAGQYPSEPIFVPRAPAQITEDEGWLLTLAYDAPRHASHLAVLDARRLEEGPIARAWFDHHIPLTFHGAWTDRLDA